MGEDPDIDIETFTTTLEMIQAEFKDKADGYATIIDSLNCDIAQIAKEIQRLQALKKTIETKEGILKNNLMVAMEATGNTKFKTAIYSFGIQNNKPSVVLDVEWSEIPDQYLIQQEPKINKDALYEDLKNGVDLGVAHLEQGRSLRIR